MNLIWLATRMYRPIQGIQRVWDRISGLSRLKFQPRLKSWLVPGGPSEGRSTSENAVAAQEILSPCELREGIKVRVAGEKNERMFENERRDPHIVSGDWGALLAELAVNVRVVMRGLLAGVDNSDTRL